jgi:hypothetical protein
MNAGLNVKALELAIFRLPDVLFGESDDKVPGQHKIREETVGISGRRSNEGHGEGINLTVLATGYARFSRATTATMD